MNFKKYHVSKNLFSGWYEVGVLINNGTVDSSSAYANYRTTDFIGVDELTSYAFSLINPVYSTYPNTSSRAAFYDTNKQFIRIEFYYNRPEVFEQTINIPENAAYVRLTGRFSDENIMLNIGSTPEPYEPYSPEVWHDSHYIRVNGEWQAVASAHERSGGQWD